MKKFPINRSNIIIFILAIALLIGTVYGAVINRVLREYQQGRSPYTYTEDSAAAFFPFDEEEAAAIDDSEQLKEGETWAIYMYLNASNLELSGHSQLSDFVEFMISEENEARKAELKQTKRDRVKAFIANEEENGVPLPISYYDADYEKGDQAVIPEESHKVSDDAWGSEILAQFKGAELPDNVTFVVQAGGAPAWRDDQVNPNRTRRFVKEGDQLVEVYDAPITNMGESETLTDFLKFCKENYPADHTMVILTDHGGAMTGFGWDYIFGEDNLTIRELTQAFDDAYGLDENDPPIDLVYFNACLMSNTDVINAMRGVTKYMIAGEEVGLAVYKYYGMLCESLCENPLMNAQQLGKALIDCYVEEITEYGGKVGEPQTTGMGLLDMKKAPLVYDAYAGFARKVLEDVTEEPEILAELSRAVSGSISFAVNSYQVYNVTDLGLWIERMADRYPEDSKNINALIDDAVLYSRNDGYLLDARGISVYFPNYIETTGSLAFALNYIMDISYSKDISTLYYYKLAGCLNEEYTQYCNENGLKVPETINYGAMSILRNSEITLSDEIGNVTAQIDPSAFDILTDARYELCKVNESADTLTYYGEDKFVGSDGGTGILTDFEGKWVSIGGKPFYVEVINIVDNKIIYASPIMYEDYEHKLIIECEVDEETGEDTYKILGIRHNMDEAATIDRNSETLEIGSYITPIYYQSDSNGGRLTKKTGKAVLYNVNTRIQDEELSKGTYRVRIVYENMRGEDAYSAPVFFEIK